MDDDPLTRLETETRAHQQPSEQRTTLPLGTAIGWILTSLAAALVASLLLLGLVETWQAILR